MSTVVFVNKVCFVCGTEDRYADIGVMNIGRAEDLDGRPSDAHRSAIYMLMKRCSACGYCAPDIDTGPPEAAILVKDPTYQKQLNDPHFPETANFFLCWSMLQTDAEAYNEAGKALLFAAWVCDDSSSFRDKARILRKEAIQFFLKAQKRKQSFAKTAFDELSMLIDLMRRSGMVKEAQKLCAQGLKEKNLSEKEEMILLYQEELLAKNDRKRHTISEATSN